MKIKKFARLNALKLKYREGKLIKTALLQTQDKYLEINIDNINLKQLVDKYDLAITNLDTQFILEDYHSSIYFKINIWNEEIELLKHGIQGFSHKIQEKILEMLDELKPNVNICNIGFTSSDKMNSLVLSNEISSNIINELAPYIINTWNAESEAKDFFNVPDMWRDILLKNKIEKVKCMILDYTNDFSNEGWNGPQNYGWIEYFDDRCNIREDGEYEFSAKYLETINIEENINLIFNDTTFISLNGNNINKVKICCFYKDLIRFYSYTDDNYILDGLSYELKNLLLKG